MRLIPQQTDVCVHYIIEVCSYRLIIYITIHAAFNMRVWRVIWSAGATVCRGGTKV